MKPLLVHALLLLLAATLCQPLAAAESDNSLNFAIGGPNPMPHCKTRIYTIEFEHGISPQMVMVVRASGVNYTRDNVEYLEDGKLRGIDLGARYYHATGMQGFYSGVSLGYWQDDWSFIKYRNTTTPVAGEADSTSVRLNVDVGYRFQLRNSNISIMPELDLGKFFSSASCDYSAPTSMSGSSCSQKSDVEAYLFAGVAVGIAF